MVILVTSKNEEDLIKNEGARMLKTLNIDFSTTQGQLSPQSEVESGRKSNSSEISSQKHVHVMYTPLNPTFI